MVVSLPTLDQLDASGKTILLRTDLNVPMEGGRITDATRLERSLPTIRELLKKKAKVVILSHFSRPEGNYVPSMSLAPLVDALASALGQEVAFGVDCVGSSAKETVANLLPGGVALMENLRFHMEEETGDTPFVQELASLGDAYVNDAFSCSHRAHASITGLPSLLPSYAGRLLEEEVTQLDTLCSQAQKPMTAIVGGAKVSTKLALLENLMHQVDVLIIGGAMANTFLVARGISIGKSLFESRLVPTAKKILKEAEARNCRIILPVDVSVSEILAPHAKGLVTNIEDVPEESMIIDIGTDTLIAYNEILRNCKTVIWNGPVGAFETAPFDHGTVGVARLLAKLTRAGTIKTIAGGGDTVAAIAHAGLTNEFTYLSTAGGAFLEWLEGKTLPGIAALLHQPADNLRTLHA